MNLTGTIPPEVSLLRGLSAVSLGDNRLRGSLPLEIFTLPHLDFLDVASNQFTGTLPDQWWRAHLKFLGLRHNPLSIGSIPSEIAMLTDLQFLHLTDTGVTGAIPTEFYTLTKLGKSSSSHFCLAVNKSDPQSNIIAPEIELEWLLLRWNDITGTIGTEIGQLVNVQFLSMQLNPMSGTIPSEIGLLTKLKELDLWGMGLQGTIPDELYTGGLQTLNALILGHNSLTGTVSSLMANLPNLSHLLLQKNPYLIGTLPTEIGLLNELGRLNIDRTGMTGTIPTEVCVRRSDSLLQRVSADCLPTEGSNGTIPMLCTQPCCTKCCNRGTGQCIKYQN